MIILDLFHQSDSVKGSIDCILIWWVTLWTTVTIDGGKCCVFGLDVTGSRDSSVDFWQNLQQVLYTDGA